MNEISALGHAALWKKYGLKNAPSAVIAKVETPHSIPSQTIDIQQPLPSEPIDIQQVPCSPLQPCASSPDKPPSVPHIDTSESIEMEPFEEQRQLPSSPVMSLKECLAEKTKIDHVLAERDKLGLFLIESTERPIISNKTALQESAEAIRSKIHRATINHFYDNVEALKVVYQCYQLSHIDVIAIRLYTTSIAYVVNDALRNYSFHGIPIPTDFLPYIYALLNGLAKLNGDGPMDEYCGVKLAPGELIRYMPALSDMESEAVQPVIDAHQLEAYVMYPAFTSSSERDLLRTMWRYEVSYRFDIKSRSAIPIAEFSINPSQYEFVFPPGAIFRVLDRVGSLFEIEEVLPRRLRARRAELPC